MHGGSTPLPTTLEELKEKQYGLIDRAIDALTSKNKKLLTAKGTPLDRSQCPFVLMFGFPSHEAKVNTTRALDSKAHIDRKVNGKARVR
jgi:hypothetical protein